MDVSEVFQEKLLARHIENQDFVELTGWLVVIDAKLFVLEKNLADPYIDSKKIEVSGSSIVFSVRASISPLGGGKSFVFHKVKIIGKLIGSHFPKIEVEKLFLENDSNKFMEISLVAEDIKRAKEKYGDSVMKKGLIDSDDWLDYF